MSVLEKVLKVLEVTAGAVGTGAGVLRVPRVLVPRVLVPRVLAPRVLVLSVLQVGAPLARGRFYGNA